MSSHVRLHREGAVAVVTLDQPDRGNALGPRAMGEGAALIRAAAEDPDVRALVLRGTGGRVFCSGYDLRELGAVGDEVHGDTDLARVGQVVPELAELWQALSGFPWPTIAQINGHAIGGGALLSTACDLRYLAAGARWSIPAARIGIFYPLFGIRRLAALIGLARTTEVLLFADSIDPERGERWGLFHEVVPPAQLASRVHEVAAELATRAPLSLQALCATLRACGTEAQPNEIIELHGRWMGRCVQSQDLVEGISAVLERRPPSFIGA